MPYLALLACAIWYEPGFPSPHLQSYRVAVLRPIFFSLFRCLMPQNVLYLRSDRHATILASSTESTDGYEGEAQIIMTPSLPRSRFLPVLPFSLYPSRPTLSVGFHSTLVNSWLPHGPSYGRNNAGGWSWLRDMACATHPPVSIIYHFCRLLAVHDGCARQSRIACALSVCRETGW